MLPFTTNKIKFQLKSVSLLTLFFFLAFAFIPLETVYSAITQEVTASWDYTSPPPEELAGFRLYQDGYMIYQINDPFASQVPIVILVDNAPSVFTITAFDVNDNESLHSTAFTYTPPLPSVDSDGDGLLDDVDPCPNDAANDVDGDGVCIEEGDCDDSDSNVNPGITEACDDGIDNNCDGNVDEGCPVIGDFILEVNARKTKGDKYADLIWNRTTSDSLDVLRNGGIIVTIPNYGFFTHGPFRAGKVATYRVCEAETSTCSNEVTVSW